MEHDASSTPTAGSDAERAAFRDISKGELLAQWRRLVRFTREYGDLLERIADTGDWRQRAAEQIRAHRAQVDGPDSPLEALDPGLALVQTVLRRTGRPAISFRLPSRVGPFPEQENAGLLDFSRQLRDCSLPVEHIAARVLPLAAEAHPEERERMASLLASVAALFKSVVRQDWDDLTLLLDHINLVTSSRERHDLVQRIARLAREIYDSLNEVSEQIVLEHLSSTTEEIPDAVDKLRSVIGSLEEAANANLDALERLGDQMRQNAEWVGQSLAVAQECEAEIDTLKAAHPELEAPLERARGVLREEVSDRLAGLGEEFTGHHRLMLTLMSNQSFQDLTGQTLKRVIDFIERLEFHLIELLQRHAGEAPARSGPGGEASGEPAGRQAQSQEEVDELLTDLGF